MLSDYLSEHAELLGYLAIFSGLGLILAILLLPAFIGSLSEDYFKEMNRTLNTKQRPTVLKRLLGLAKNLLGFILILLGVLMLVLPGQGILTILMGLILMNYPGKYKLERKLISQPKILATVNWLRRKQHKKEFNID